MGSDMMNKTEKIHWFEKKLNKWVKLFEESEKENGNRHNDLVDKANEIDSFYKGTCKGLDKRVRALESNNGLPLGGDEKDKSIGHSSDNVSDLSRQTAKRLNKVKTKGKGKNNKTSHSPTMLRKPPKRDPNDSILSNPTHLEMFKLAEHKLDGEASPTKISNKKDIENERSRIKGADID